MSVTIDGTAGVNLVQDGSIKQADLETAIIPIGVGQTWQNLTASRAVNTDYTNTTGRPIQLMVNCVIGATGTYFRLLINGTQYIDYTSGGAQWISTMSCIIPNGATYRVNSNSSVAGWGEPR